MTNKLIHANICHALECNLYPALQRFHCFIPGSVECSQHMPAPRKRRQKARSENRSLRKWSLRGQQKLLRHAILTLGEGCNTLLMSTNSSKACFATLICQALSSSVFDHTYICVLSVRDLLCACAHLVVNSLLCSSALGAGLPNGRFPEVEGSGNLTNEGKI